MSVAALSALGCPAASATAAIAAGHARAGRHHARRPGGYVYEMTVTGSGWSGAQVRAVCSGRNAVIPGTLLYPFNHAAAELFVDPHADLYDEAFNVTVDASTRLVATGAHATEVSNVCAMNDTYGANGNGYVEPGVFTWRLAAPARSIAEVVRHHATEAVMISGGE